MYSIRTERYDPGYLNKPRYMFLPSLVHEVSPEQSKYLKHLTGFWGTVIASVVFKIRLGLVVEGSSFDVGR